jgi:uncharacterized protein YciI
MKKYFALHLLPPRPTFAQDMSPEERSIMQRHVAYWTDLMDKGKVLVFGPVIDPNGVYGLGVIAVDHEDEVEELTSHDPAIAINRYEIFPMMAMVPKK